MDLPELVSIVGFADQRVARVRDRVHTSVAVLDVAALPETDLYKGVSHR